jgi:AcrR family transcriptional regulator
MDEIAGDVGLAKPSLYYYYPTKESLFRAVIAQEQGQFVRDMEELLTRSIPASQKLKEYVGVRFREITSISVDLFKNLEERELKAIQRILVLGRSSGEFSCADPHETAQLLLHVLHGLRLRVFRREEGTPVSDEDYDALKNESVLFVNVLLHALQNHH